MRNYLQPGMPKVGPEFPLSGGVLIIVVNLMALYLFLAAGNATFYYGNVRQEC